MEFAVNIPYADVKTYLSRASIGLHSMVDEHFGITVVEFMVSWQAVLLCSCIRVSQDH